MAKMTHLDPAPKEPLPCDGWELLATEAGRYATGLRATVQLWNSHLQAVQQLDLAQPKSWAGFISDIAAQLTLPTSEPIREAVLRLAAGVEGVLRQMEAAPQHRSHEEKDEAQGQPITFADDDEAPWPTPVEGDVVLDAIAATYRRYLVLPAGGADALALWTLHSHAHVSSVVSPLLALQSPQKRCGKTTTMQILSGLVARALPCSNITPAAVFRTVERYRPTLMLDEADTYLGHEHDDLRGILNSGHTQATAFVIRTVGEDHEPRRFCTWAPKVVALIGALPSTLADRSIALHLQRKAPGEHVERWRVSYVDQLTDLRRQARRWAEDHEGALTNADPLIPETLHDRAADNWRPLLAIADAAGGDWPRRAREAIRVIEGVEEDTEELGVLLLRDLQQLFTERDKDKLSSADICEALAAMTERPWRTLGRGEKAITPHRLARMLAPYGIVSRTIRLNDDSTDKDASTIKGYLLETCQNAFFRYSSPIQTVTTSQPAPALGGEAKIKTSQEPDVTFQKVASTPTLPSDVSLLRFENGKMEKNKLVADHACSCGEVMPEGRKVCFACGQPRDAGGGPPLQG